MYYSFHIIMKCIFSKCRTSGRSISKGISVSLKSLWSNISVLPSSIASQISRNLWREYQDSSGTRVHMLGGSIQGLSGAQTFLSGTWKRTSKSGIYLIISPVEEYKGHVVPLNASTSSASFKEGLVWSHEVCVAQQWDSCLYTNLC